MEIVKWGIVVTGILLLRKAAWGRISRRMQYGIWIVTVHGSAIYPGAKQF